MPEKNRAVVITILGVIFILSTVYLNFLPSTSKKSSNRSELVSILANTNKTKTGLSDISKGETVPNWKKAVLAQAKIDDPTGVLVQTEIGTVDTKNLNDPNNITAQYTKNVYTATAVMSQNKELTPEEKKDIAKSVFTQEVIKGAARVYVFKDVTSTKSTPATIKYYGNLLGAVLILTLGPVLQYDDIAIIKDYGTSKKESALKPFDEKIVELTSLRDTLLIMPTPTSALVYHLSLINAVETYRQTLVNLRSIQEDPLRAGLGVSDYTTVYHAFFIAIDNFKEYFSLTKTVFTQKETGYFISKGVIQ